MSGQVLGEVKLSGSSRLVFSISVWQGEARADIRKYAAGERYNGPTPSGLSLTGPVLQQLLARLNRLAKSVPRADGLHSTAARKSRTSEIRVAVIPPESGESLPKVDVREFIETASYAGLTKKGIRFAWDELPRVMKLLEVQAAALAGVASGNAQGLHGLKSALPPERTAALPAADSESADCVDDLLPVKLKSFPADYLPPGVTKFTNIFLPKDVLRITQDRDGAYLVKSRRGFQYPVRNEVEGKFLLYAQQRGVENLLLPTEMIHVFKAVVAYEKETRELRQKLVSELEERCGNRSLAEFQADQILKDRGLQKL